jgi:Zn-dependent M28 family amino/carboxypeptidase
MFPVLAGPALAAAGALTGSKLLAVLGGALSLAAVAVFADIARSPVVPAANDNISGVVCLQELARRLAALPPKGLRVWLVSTGSEESLMEGMHRFARRHFPDLPVQDTFVLCVDTVGSGKLLVLRGEGMLKLYRYPQPALELMDGLAGRLGIELEPDVMLRNATDGLYALKAGFPSAMLGSVSEHGAPGNYHWPTDTPENVNYETLADAVRLCTALVHRLAQRWPF